MDQWKDQEELKPGEDQNILGQKNMKSFQVQGSVNILKI